MIGKIAYPGTESVTYRRGSKQPQDPQQGYLQTAGEALAQKAERVKDFFIAADNTEIDRDPDEGEVYIVEAEAPGLVEISSDRVRGTYRDGTLKATGWRTDMNASSIIVIGENNIFTDRDSHLNSSYLANTESLTTNEDGSLTYATAWRIRQ